MPLTPEQLRNGALAYDAPVLLTPPPGTAFAPWSHKQFEDAHLPPPSAAYRYVAGGEDLFRTEPDFADVQQGAIGDCYLLSAINALIRTKPHDFFREMIGGDADYVHVRFFAPVGPAFQPVVVRVPRTILHAVVKGRAVPLQKHGAVWPYFIEKAYAFFRTYYLQPLSLRRLIKIPGRAPPLPAEPTWPFPNVVCPPPKAPDERYARTYIEALTGGSTGRAYQHLTGEEMEWVSPTKTISGKNGDIRLPTSVFRCELLRAMLDEARPSALDMPWEALLDAFLEVAGRKLDALTGPLAGGAVPPTGLPDLRLAIRQHVRATRADRRPAVDKCLKLIASKIEYRQEMRQEDIAPLIEKIQPDDVDDPRLGLRPFNFGNVIDDFIFVSFPGKRGTGIYADYQENLFSKIEIGLKPMGGTVSVAFAGTKKVLGTEPAWLILRKNIKSKKKGLVPGHAYLIGDTHKIEITAKGGTKELCFVYLRNPWSNYIRRYVPKIVEAADGSRTVSLSGKAVDDIASLPRNAVTILEAELLGREDEVERLRAFASRDTRQSAFFPVELSDLTKFFDDVAISV
ncbi:C2 family cysteine protease [Ancylobacter sp.]|uniref:C2 family cysteine protease n=1 Tax=Ancylobacter sp. TaxID=1872567 RepID=UPI003D0F2A89